jgi:hypothetical protein
MRFRKLRIAWSVGCGILCVLLIALWVRSYWWVDLMLGKNCSLTSLEGCILSNFGEDPTRQQVLLFSQNLNELREAGSILRSGATRGFAFRRTGRSLTIGLPHLVVALVPASLVVAPWLPGRFSLRTLLIATTLVAVVLGLVVWVARE